MSTPQPTPAPPPPSGAILIGPTRAGKTSLVATLEIASRLTTYPTLGRIRVRHRNDVTKQLFSSARLIGERGKVELPGTTKPDRYEAEVRYVRPRRGLFSPAREEVFQFSMVDGPGGDSIGSWSAPAGPAAGADWGEGSDGAAGRDGHRDELLASATRCSGLVVCVDAADPTSAGLFFRGLNDFLADVAERTPGGVLPFARVAIVLTKADRLVEGEGPRAEAALAATDPRAQVRRLIGDIALGDLFTYLSPAARREVRCGWASVYGFIPEDGAVNFISGSDGGGRLAVYREGGTGWLNHWRPFRILDPFVYIATGEPAALVPMTDPTAGAQ